MRPWILGITGGIGSGKSAVLQAFKELGVHTVDADEVARIVVQPGSAALVQIAAYFGAHILLPDGQLDRAQLRVLIFNAPKQRQWLEALLHPLIGVELHKQLALAESAYAVFASPLLFETDQQKMAQRTLLIDTPESLQMERVLARDRVSRQQVEAILQAQASRSERLSKADDVIVNDRDLPWLRDAVQRLHQRYLLLSQGAL